MLLWSLISSGRKPRIASRRSASSRNGTPRNNSAPSSLRKAKDGARSSAPSALSCSELPIGALRFTLGVLLHDKIAAVHESLLTQMGGSGLLPCKLTPESHFVGRKSLL